jgi:hypothetical protein
MRKVKLNKLSDFSNAVALFSGKQNYSGRIRNNRGCNEQAWKNVRS